MNHNYFMSGKDASYNARDGQPINKCSSLASTRPACSIGTLIEEYFLKNCNGNLRNAKEHLNYFPSLSLLNIWDYLDPSRNLNKGLMRQLSLSGLGVGGHLPWVLTQVVTSLATLSYPRNISPYIRPQAPLTHIPLSTFLSLSVTYSHTVTNWPQR